jgi:oligopeptidase B
MIVRQVHNVLIGLLVLTGTLMPQTSTAQERATATPPVAKKVPHIETLHGEKRVDDYYWLRGKEKPEVIAYLDAENAYTDAMTKDSEPFQQALYQEMLGRIKQTDLSVPYRLRGYYYYSRTEEGKQYPIYCRKPGSLDGAEQVVLDLNELSQGHKYMALGSYVVSDDDQKLAFSLDTTGFRQYTLHVKDLATGQWGPDQAEKVGSVAWAADNATIFYTVEDAAKRQYRAYRHRWARRSHRRVDLRREGRTLRDRRPPLAEHGYIFLESESHTATEVRYLRRGPAR